MAGTSQVLRVDEILIRVSDIHRSVGFYRTGLGLPFEPTEYGDDSYQARVGETRPVSYTHLTLPTTPYV